MIVKKGDKLTIIDGRKTPTSYDAVATKEFDTDKDEWFEIKLDQEESVHGINNIWYKGDDLPCRRGISKIIPRKPKESE